MEEFTYQAILGATFTEVFIRVGWFLSGSLLTMVGFWGLRKRIAALEAKNSVSPSIQQVLNIETVGSEKALRTALQMALEARESAQLASLMETVNQLPTYPLRDGHRYAALPDRTTVVIMADGTLRLATPMRLEIAMSGTITGEASLSITQRPIED